MNNIAEGLRGLADDIEEGKFGDVTVLAIVVGNKDRLADVVGYYGNLVPETDVAIAMYARGVELMLEKKNKCLREH